MRKLSMAAVALALVVSASVCAEVKYTPSKLLSEAARRASAEAVESLEADKDVKQGMRIAIVPLAGQEAQRVERALRSALNDKKVELYADSSIVKSIVVPKVLDDMKLADIMDENTKTELKNKSVQGLLFGIVEEARATETLAEIRVSLSLVAIETAQILWSAQVEKGVEVKPSVPPPPPPPVIGGVIMFAAALVGIAVIVFCAGRRRKMKGKPESVEAKIEKDREICQKMGRELGRAKAALKDAQDAAFSAEKHELVNAIKDGVDKIGRLADDVKLAPAGGSSLFKSGPVKAEIVDKLVAHDSVLEQLLDEITAMADKVKSAAPDDEGSCRTNLIQLGNLSDQLRRKVEERRDFLAQ